MPRNTGGNYSQPNGTFTTGTVIRSDVMNEKFGDIATALTDSLSRSGNGDMLSSLRLIDGSAAIPSLSFTNDPEIGLYLAGVNDLRMVSAAANLQKWATTGVTIYPAATLSSTLTVTGACTLSTTLAVTGATTLTGAVTTAAGLTATNSTANGAAITATGNGTGAGIVTTGGASNGRGMTATGTGNAPGLYAGAGPTAAGAIEAVGSTAGGPALYAVPGIAATSGVPRYAVQLASGHLLFSPVVNPANTVGMANAVTPANTIKAHGKATTGASSVTLNGGFNLTASVSGNNIRFSFPSGGAMGNTNYTIDVKDTLGPQYKTYVASQQTTYFDIGCTELTVTGGGGSAAVLVQTDRNLSTLTGTVYVTAVGTQ